MAVAYFYPNQACYWIDLIQTTVNLTFIFFVVCVLKCGRGCVRTKQFSKVSSLHTHTHTHTWTHTQTSTHTCALAQVAYGDDSDTLMWHTTHHTATHCNTLQLPATHCNKLQHRRPMTTIVRLPPQRRVRVVEAAARRSAQAAGIKQRKHRTQLHEPDNIEAHLYQKTWAQLQLRFPSPPKKKKKLKHRAQLCGTENRKAQESLSSPLLQHLVSRSSFFIALFYWKILFYNYIMS